mmetsp:Transcript_100581/g.194230  ORF Transcript_100581/g.194230 Transcript_100581/m.194230 type:complete len:328 (-) Transcript_100581:88-1071(-)
MLSDMRSEAWGGPLSSSSCTVVEPSQATKVQAGTPAAQVSTVRGAVHVDVLSDEQLQALWPRGDGPKALFLDYDGTLREFEPRPELAVPTPELHDLLAALNARKDLVVHIISGRNAEFLNTHFGAYNRLVLIAEHERRVAGRFQIWTPPNEARGAVTPDCEEAWKLVLLPEMEDFARQVPGTQVEEKATGLVWHYRGVADKQLGSQAASLLLQRLRRLVQERHLMQITVLPGKMTVEVSHRGLKKAQAMCRIFNEQQALPGSGKTAATDSPFAAVLVAGDGASDEPMFTSAASSFLTVKVGHEPTAARFHVDDPAQLRTLLWRIAAS